MTSKEIWTNPSGHSVDQARTVAVNAFVTMELFYLFCCRSLNKSILQLGFFTNLWVLIGAFVMFVFQLAYTYLPIMNDLFQSAPISLAAWIRVIIAGIVTYALVEVNKRLQSVKLIGY